MPSKKSPTGLSMGRAVNLTDGIFRKPDPIKPIPRIIFKNQ